MSHIASWARLTLLQAFYDSLERTSRHDLEYPAVKDPTESTKSGTLGALPAEIILLIVDLLPPHAAAALSLTSHTYFDLLGEKSLARLEDDEVDRFIFLSKLETQLPVEYLFCHLCEKFHHPTSYAHTTDEWDDDLAVIRIRNRECFDLDRMGRYQIFYHRSFRHEHVQMAMKLHRRGIDSKSYLESLSLSERPHTKYPNWYQTLHAHMSSDGSGLYIRRQDYLFQPPYPSLPTIPDKFAPICSHISPSSTSSSLVTTFLSGTLDVDDPSLPSNGGWTSRTRLYQCPHCRTEYRLDRGLTLPSKTSTSSFTSPEKQVVVCLTKWQYVGTGTSPIETDWIDHLQHAWGVPGAGGGKGEGCEYEFGSCFEGFEGRGYMWDGWTAEWRDGAGEDEDGKGVWGSTLEL